MTNALSKAGKRLFAHDPDVRPYAAADTAYDDGEYVPEHTEDERADADRRKVSQLNYNFLPTPTHASLSPPTHSFPPATRQCSLLASYTYTARHPPWPFRKRCRHSTLCQAPRQRSR
jgi:hypothetical protein